MERTESWKRAIEAAGSVSAMSRLVNRTRQAVSVKSRPPPEWCLIIEKATGVSVHELRPDIFGEE